jgi:single-strand DNA-binding protein
LGKGAPVIVVGHVYTSEYEDRDGNRRSSLEMRATSVGPDLSRVFVRIEKPSYTGPTTGDAPAPTVTPADASDEAASAGDDAAVQSGDSTALPLSA